MFTEGEFESIMPEIPIKLHVSRFIREMQLDFFDNTHCLIYKNLFINRYLTVLSYAKMVSVKII